MSLPESGAISLGDLQTAAPSLLTSSDNVSSLTSTGTVSYVNITEENEADDTHTGSFACTVSYLYGTTYGIILAGTGSNGLDFRGTYGFYTVWMNVTLYWSGGSITFSPGNIVDWDSGNASRFLYQVGDDPTSTLNGKTITQIDIEVVPYNIYKVTNGTANYASLITSPPSSGKFAIGPYILQTSRINTTTNVASVSNDELQFYYQKEADKVVSLGQEFKIVSGAEAGSFALEDKTALDFSASSVLDINERLTGRFDITSDDTYHSSEGNSDAAYLRFLGHPGSGGGSLGVIQFADEDNDNNVHALIEGEKHAAPLSGNRFPGELKFYVGSDRSGEEYMQLRYNITDQGQHKFNSSASTSLLLTDELYGNSSTTFSLFMASNTDATVFKILKHGNVQNTNNSYGAISDIKLKENVIDASSQWDDIKNIQVRKYNYKPETGLCTHTQLGVIAQEIELVSPGLVEEVADTDKEGNDLGTTTKTVNYSVLYMKAIKALQEAIERIEVLEAKVDALEG